MWPIPGQSGQSGLLIDCHEGGHLNEGPKVSNGLFVAGGHAPVVVDLVPKALDQIAILRPLSVVGPRLRCVLPARDHRFAATRRDEVYQLFAVDAIVADYHLEGDLWQQGFRLGHIGVLARRQHGFHRQAQAVHGCVDLGAKAAPAAAQRLGLRSAVFLGAPVAC